MGRSLRPPSSNDVSTGDRLLWGGKKDWGQRKLYFTTKIEANSNEQYANSCRTATNHITVSPSSPLPPYPSPTLAHSLLPSKQSGVSPSVSNLTPGLIIVNKPKVLLVQIFLRIRPSESNVAVLLVVIPAVINNYIN